MSNTQLMGHTNSMLGIVTFEEDTENPHEVITTVHHVIGWFVNTPNRPAYPLVPGLPAGYLKDRKWYPMFMPEAIVMNYPELGDSTPLDKAIEQHATELLTRERTDRKEYNH